MSMVYIITQSQMDMLNERLELQAIRDNNIARLDKTGEEDSLYRAFNYVVRNW